MNRPNRYSTSHSIAVLEYMKQNANKHLTAHEVHGGLNTLSVKIGSSTVYRQLKKYAQKGIVAEYKMKDHTCYQFKTDKQSAQTLHCKCLNCDKVFHIPCRFSADIDKHLTSHHAFSLDITQTILYGKCKECTANYK